MDSTETRSSHIWRLFGFAYAITASYILCRAVADAVLLSRLGAKSLPMMILLGAITVGVVSFVWARRTRKQSLPRVIGVTQLGTALATGCIYLQLKVFPESSLVIGGLYLLAEMRSCLSAILIALLLNYGENRESDKRPFALVNAGAPLAGISLGIFIGAEATVLPASTLLLLCCGFDLIAWAIIAKSPLVSRTRISARKLKSHAAPIVFVPQDQSLESQQNSLSYGKLILSVVVCKTVVLTLIDYEWKVFAADHYSISEGRLTSYFGIFYATSDALTLVLQLVIAKYFLRRKTMGIGLYLLPVYLIVIATATLLTDNAMMLFWLMTFARGSLVIRRGLYDVIVQVLYGWLPRTSRRATVASILGIAKPIAEATTAISIVAFAAFVPAQTLTWIWLPAILTWAFVLKRLIRFWKQMPRVKPSHSTS
ncbi:MAG: hypothetical protein ABJZ55_14830 [Fuerstiella sp.]